MQEFLLALPVLLFSMVVHEYAHGYAALKQGDDTALKMGRLTLNPLKHIDIWMTILMPLILWFGSGGRFIFGGAKPVPVNPNNYREYRRGDIIVSAAGVISNLILAVAFTVLALVTGILGRSMGSPAILVLLQTMAMWGIWLNLLLAFFNLIPIPPLDGSHILYHFLPPELGKKYRELSRFGILILLGIFYFFPKILPVLLLPALILAGMAFGFLRPFELEPFRLF